MRCQNDNRYYGYGPAVTRCFKTYANIMLAIGRYTHHTVKTLVHCGP